VTAQSNARPLGPRRAILYGTLAVAVLDGLDAAVFFGLRGASPVRVFQAIAAGLLGRDAFQGGAPTAALGVLLHCFISFVVVCVYHAASTKLPALKRSPLLWGPLYGIGVYLVMNFVVLPLSAAGAPRLSTPVVVNGVLAHVFFVGMPSALFARRA
jgi:hypothetical protein